MPAPTLEDFKTQCIVRLKAYASSKGEDNAAGHYFEDVSLLLKLLNAQTVRNDNQLYKLVKKL